LSVSLCRTAKRKFGSGYKKEDLSARAIAAMNFVAIDFETANYQPDSACALGLVKVVGGVIVDKQVHLIRPPTRDFAFTYIHGLTWKDVAKKDDFGNVWLKVESLLHGVEFLAAHNASFDRRVLEACCATYRIPAPSLPFQCTVQVARRTWGIYPTKLSNVCEKLEIELNHHEALSDAMACAKIMIAATSGSTATNNVAQQKRIGAVLTRTRRTTRHGPT
jgi:DNA polymerase III subunit epsilon